MMPSFVCRTGILHLVFSTMIAGPALGEGGTLDFVLDGHTNPIQGRPLKYANAVNHGSAKVALATLHSAKGLSK